MMYIASVFSQLERETIAERIRDNLHELAKTGRWLGGITPTGFASEAVQAVTVDGRTKRACRLRLLPEEAETVKAMYSLFARLGSLTAVVKGLQERGLATKNGNAFTRHAVRDILHNPVYARADADMLAWLRNAGAELSATQEEFDGRHGVLAYHRTDQSRGRTAVCPAAGGLGSSRLGSTPASSPAHSGPPCRSGSGGRTAARRVRSTRRPPCSQACCSADAADRCMPSTAARQTASASPMSAVRNRPVDGNNAAARTFLALQQTPPCAPCSAPCRRTMPRWRPHSGGCGAACLNPPLRRRTVSPSCSAIAWTPSAGRSASLRP